MATTAETWVRLLGALEDLAAQEALLLRGSDFAGVLATQARAGPLIARLATLAETADAGVRLRVKSVLALRARSLEWLETEMSRVRDELQTMQVSSRRVAQFAPVYGHGPRGAPTQFNAQG